MRAGTYRVSSTREEYVKLVGRVKATYTREFVIKLENFYGKDRHYQTETVYRNNCIMSAANYPADTDYAKERRALAGLIW